MADQQEDMEKCNVCALRLTKEICKECNDYTCLECWSDGDEKMCLDCWESKNKKAMNSNKNKRGKKRKQSLNVNSKKKLKNKQIEHINILKSERQSIMNEVISNIEFTKTEAHGNYLIDSLDLTAHLSKYDQEKKEILGHLAVKTVFGHLKQMISIIDRSHAEVAAANHLLYNEDDNKGNTYFKKATDMARIVEDLLILVGRQSLKAAVKYKLFDKNLKDAVYVQTELSSQEMDELVWHISNVVCDKNITFKGKEKIHQSIKGRCQGIRFKLRKKMKDIFTGVTLDTVPTDEAKWIDYAQQFLVQQVDTIMDENKTLNYEEKLLKSVQSRRALITMFEQLPLEKARIFEAENNMEIED